MLRISGYNTEYRYRILCGAILRHTQLLEDEQNGVIPSFYRNRQEMIASTVAKGGKSNAATWFLKGGVTCTLTTSATPGSILKNRLQSALKTIPAPDGGSTKVIEASGIPITCGLKKANPFKKDGCQFGDPGCAVDPKTDCGTMGACYVLTCGDCGDAIPVPQVQPLRNQGGADIPLPSVTVVRPGTQAIPATMTAGMRRNTNKGSRNRNKPKKVPQHAKQPHYIGTSARSLHARMSGHSSDIRGKVMSNAMAKHNASKHANMDTPKCTMTMLSMHHGNVDRQVSEGLHLEKQDPEFSLNDRLEWARARIVRIVASTI
jgi:hypothetical protein